MKKILGRNNRIYCLTNICVCLLCSSCLYNSYNINENLNEELNGITMENDSDPLSDLEKDKNNILSFITDKTENLVENIKKEEAKKKVVKTVTKKKVVSSNKKITSSKKYVKPNYSSVTGSAVVDYAKKYIGLRYVSGGNSLTTGTDCSGFTKLIYKEFGITLSRSVKSQAKNGYYVKKSDLQKGDLIFYGYKSGVVSHVAIYIGNGKVIHQSTPKSGVKINSMNMMVYITARRVITKPATTSPNVKNDSTNEANNNQNNNSNNTPVVDNTNQNNNDNNTPVVDNTNQNNNDNNTPVVDNTNQNNNSNNTPVVDNTNQNSNNEQSNNSGEIINIENSNQTSSSNNDNISEIPSNNSGQITQ